MRADAREGLAGLRDLAASVRRLETSLARIAGGGGAGAATGSDAGSSATDAAAGLGTERARGGGIVPAAAPGQIEVRPRHLSF